MDSGKIKALATGARTKLMDGVRASLKRVLAPDSTESINDKGHVDELRREAKEEEALVERVAYTWFNRLCALRLMDSRGYTPLPVVTPRDGETMPAILADARRGVYCSDFPLKPEQRQRVTELLAGNTTSVNPLGEAYVILLLSACDYYAKPIPDLFGADLGTVNAMRLLAPTSLLSEDSVLQDIVEGMDDENCGEVEVMGWLYQYYIAEKHDEVYAGFKKNKKAGADEIGPATQLFTPHWIVRYMVENSLGRLWMLNFPDSGLADRMDYYIAPEEPEEDFLRIDGPEDITFLDPAMGSGHILVYAFDLLYDMYLEEGYRPAEIPTLILQKNLTGFEIDQRAAEIAAFALAIKAREKDADFFDHAVRPDLTVFRSIHFDASELQDAGLISADAKLLDALAHLDEVGSLYQPDPADVILLDNASENLARKSELFASHALNNIAEAARVVDQLSRHFGVVVTNPPYLGLRNIDPNLSAWLADTYPNGSVDLYAAFILREELFTKNEGYWSIITTDSWMANSTSFPLRNAVLRTGRVINGVQLKDSAYHADTFGANLALTKHRGLHNDKDVATFFYISSLKNKADEMKEAVSNSNSNIRYTAVPGLFSCIEGSPLTAYKATKRILEVFSLAKGMCIGGLSDITGSQNITAGNERYLRLWWEVGYSHIGKAKRWVAYEKGGQFRRWFGNREFLVDWSDSARDFYSENRTSNLLAEKYWYKEGITYSDIASRENHFRYHVADGVFDKKGPVICGLGHNLYPLLGFLNSSVAQAFINVINPATTLQVHSVKALPVLPEIIDEQSVVIEPLVIANVNSSRNDWSSFEAARSFARHPLVHGSILSDAFDAWSTECQERFNTLKSNEAELNRIFARIYNMEGEVPIEVPDDKVSVRLADRKRDVKSLISYAVGCILGRYSLDVDGLVLADQGSTISDYLAKVPNPTFMPDEDGILPITEEEWFPDDIVTEFDAWLKAAFGEEHFAENLAYIEEALGCKVREYFVKGKKSPFYDDHCKTYSVTGSGKRPIYWMFSSPKGSFNCLVYLHRYDERTVSTILTDYVRDLRRRLEVQARGFEASEIAQERARADRYHDIIDELSDWERDVLYPMAQKHIAIDLDDGVRHNYKLFPGALRKVSGLS